MNTFNIQIFSDREYMAEIALQAAEHNMTLPMYISSIVNKVARDALEEKEDGE